MRTDSRRISLGDDGQPDNVIIVADAEAPGGERAKVLDFGIAKIIGDQGAGAVNGLTQMGAVMGTPRYMSPEQCKGSGNVDGKTDVYALGVLMFIMLTGRAPFEAEGTGALMAMHIYQPPPSPTEIEPTVSAPAEALVLSMLAKDPTARPTMQEVESRLQQLAAQQQLAKTMLPPGRAASAPLPPMQPNANVTVQMRVGSDAPPRPRPRPRWQWAAGLAGGLLVVGTLWGLHGRRPEPTPAPTPPAAAPGESPAVKPSAKDEPAARNPTANPAANSGAASSGAAEPGLANPPASEPAGAPDRRPAAASPPPEEPAAAAPPTSIPASSAPLNGLFAPVSGSRPQ